MFQKKRKNNFISRPFSSPVDASILFFVLFFMNFLFFLQKFFRRIHDSLAFAQKKKRKEILSLIDLLSNVDELSLLYLRCSFVFVGFACCRIVKLGVAALLALVFDCRSLID